MIRTRGLVVLTVLLVAAWQVTTERGVSDEPAAKADTPLPADLAIVPPDAVVFGTARVADLWSSPEFQRVRQALPKEQAEGLQEFQKSTGLALGEIERMTTVLPELTGQEPEPVLILAMTRPYDRGRLIQQMIPGGKEEQIQGKTCRVDPAKHLGVCFVTDRILVLGPDKAVPAFMQRYVPKNPRGPLLEALHQAAEKHVYVAGFNPAPVLRLVGNKLPPQAEPFKPLLEMTHATAVLDAGKESKLNLRMTFPEAKSAEESEKAMLGLLFLARAGMAVLAEQLTKQPDVSNNQKALLKAAEVALKSAEVSRQKTVVSTDLVFKEDLSVLAASLFEATVRVRQAAERMQSTNNLKQLALAMHNYHDTEGHMPAQAIYSKEGKPLLSWRVMVLPFLEEGNLYTQFKLDEPWDSAHNKTLLARMPKVFVTPRVEAREPYATHYQGFVGPGAIFEGKKGLRIADFTDGLSNTLMFVEAAEPVPWTKPEDLTYTAKGPLPRLGGIFKGGFNAAFCDGSVRFIKQDVPEAILRLLITRNDGMPIPEF